MKKLIFISTIAFLSLNFSSCEKEAEKVITKNSDGVRLNQEEPLKSFKGISVENEMLKFATLEDYFAVVNDPNPETRINFLEFISQLKFDNYFTLNNTEPIAKGKQEMDEFFGQIINKDNCVQIGDHVYRTDLLEEKVFVVAVDKYGSNSLDLINGNFESNESIKVYTLSDDVLSLVNNLPVEKCSNPSSFEKSVTVSAGDPVYETKNIIKYFTAGIYYRVTGRTKKIGSWSGNYRYYLDCVLATTEIRRNPCSNSEVTSHAVGVKLNTYNDPEPVWEMYSKSWQIKSSIYIAIRSRAEFYGEDATVFKTTPNNIYSF